MLVCGELFSSEWFFKELYSPPPPPAKGVFQEEKEKDEMVWKVLCFVFPRITLTGH